MIAVLFLLLGCASEGPMGPVGPDGAQGPAGPKGDKGDPGITVVSGTSTIVSIGSGLYAGSVTFPGVSLAKAVVGCWLRAQGGSTWFKVAFDFSGTGLDSCVASDTSNGLLVSFITEKDHLWLGNILLVTVAYST
jgi:hypothetical protein